MKIAFTTSNGETIDQHFGQCHSFQIWEVGADEATFLEAISVGDHGGDEEDRIAARGQLHFRLRHRVHDADRRAGSGQAGGPEDPSNEDQQRSQLEGDCRTSAAGAARKSTPLAEEGAQQERKLVISG